MDAQVEALHAAVPATGIDNEQHESPGQVSAPTGSDSIATPNNDADTPPNRINQEELEEAITAVLVGLQMIEGFESCCISITGRLAYWNHLKDRRKNSNRVDLLVDRPVQEVIDALSANDAATFGALEDGHGVVYKAPLSDNPKEILFHHAEQFAWMPVPYVRVSDYSPEAELPYPSLRDLILFKINTCGNGTEDEPTDSDVVDAKEAEALLTWKTKAKVSAMKLDSYERNLVELGIERVAVLSGRKQSWWNKRLSVA